MGRRDDRLHRNSAPRRWTIRAALLLVLALFIAACGGGGSGGSESDQKASGKTGDENAGDPVSGGKVTFGLEAETGNGWCLPEARLDISGIQVARAMYDTLTVPSKDGSTFEPFLAESVKPNADFTEWTIKLRSGIKFTDGSDLTAQVVKNNLDAYRGKYPTRHPDLFIFVFNNVKDTSVVDPMTVKVTTIKPWASFPAHLYSSGRLGMMGQSQLDDTKNCAEKLVGTGPFTMTSRRINSGETLKKNPNYWRKDDKGNQLPYLDEIDFKPIPETQQRANALDSGDVDAYHISDGAASIFKKARQQAKDGKINMTESSKFAEVGNLMLNTGKPPFDNVVARQAVVEAINREKIRDILGFGIPKLADGPFAPGAQGYLKDSGFPGYKPDDAKKLVKQYEQQTGKKFEMVITAVGETELLKQIDLTKQDLQAAGIKVRVTTLDQSALIDKAVSGDYQSITWRNYPGFAADTLYVWWYGASKNPINFSRFDDPKVNELLDKGRATGDPAEQKQIYEDLNRELNKQYYFAWSNWTTWSVPRIKAVHQIVGGRPVGTDGSEDYEGLAVGFDPALLWRAK